MLSTQDLRLLIGLLTGQNTLNRHLTLLRVIVCVCKEEEDTSLHFVLSCCAITNERRELFGKHFLEPSDYRCELVLKQMYF